MSGKGINNIVNDIISSLQKHDSRFVEDFSLLFAEIDPPRVNGFSSSSNLEFRLSCHVILVFVSSARPEFNDVLIK